jgi:hypothetical protein
MKADECKRLCDKLGKEYLPGYEGRVINYITTNESTDRYGDIVRVKGAQLANYMKNPVVMFSHQHGDFPVGCSLTCKPDHTAKNIPAQALFLDDRVDSSGRSDLVYKFARSKMMPACSIGFMPLEVVQPQTAEERMAMGLGQHGVEYSKWDYLEFSPCSIPANPQALQNALKCADLKAVHFELRDFELIGKNEFMAPDLLDMFAESFKKNGTIFIPKSVEEVPLGEVSIDTIPPPPAESYNVDVKVNVDTEEVKKVFDDLKQLIVLLQTATTELRSAALVFPQRTTEAQQINLADAEKSMYDILAG